MNTALLLSALLLSAVLAQAGSPPTVGYTALSDAARKAGRLARYDHCAMRSGSVTLGNYQLDFRLPKSARAYDVIPVRYTLIAPAGARRVAVEAVAFENPRKAGKQPLYDLAIPGNMEVKLEFLGSVCADFDDAHYIPLTPDGKAPVSPFPPYKRDPLVCSATIRPAQAVWFKIRLTNTGDTILDPEGFGASLMQPRIAKLGPDGKEQWSAGTVNMHERQLQYIYPGESVEQWVNFTCPNLGAFKLGLVEGDYKLYFTMLYRYHRAFDWMVNIWGGKDFATLEVPLKVTPAGGSTPVKSTFKLTDPSEKMPGDFHSFEEFMTSLRVYQGAANGARQEGVIYLQVAPWTKHATVKLILTDPKQIAVARIPIKITTETLRVKYNPKNVMVLTKNGREEPIIMAQAMPGMRTGFQLGPYPEEHMRKDIMEMKALGVNVLCNTAGDWWIPELTGRKGVDLSSACYKYYYDVLAREAGMTLQGWSLYPPSAAHWYDNATPLVGRKLTYSITAEKSVDMGDPQLPEVIAAWVKHNYARWGDLWLKTKDGRVPIDIEDTWGWMRDDINLRHLVGPLAKQKFGAWMEAKYSTVAAANTAWGTHYASFDEIDPEANQGVEGDGIPFKQVYNKSDNPFHDWSPATEDWDRFRTEFRMDIYRKANDIIRKTIPGAELALRTEGANLVIKGDPKSDSMHLRHAYYAQRRNAMINDIWIKAGVLHFHSDYTTLPYTEEEWRQAMREMVAAGVTPLYLPQFDHMRDIVLNPHYGRDYKIHYGLDQPTKGMMVHCLMAAFPWWKATYEEGGAPGILYSDYLCDGFATETQKREIKVLREQFERMEQ